MLTILFVIWLIGAIAAYLYFTAPDEQGPIDRELKVWDAILSVFWPFVAVAELANWSRGG